MTPRDRARAAQQQASDPGVSAFVAASAGSGKTKLLTDRLLRLMLLGEDPARIQCLTYTKAAAAEMAVRLQRTLGGWVTLGDAALDADLTDRGLLPSARMRADARGLFARVLDLPGGMRIGTIHAFCESLLRRFPIEARLSPHFRVIEEADAAAAQQDAREDMLAGAHTEARRHALTTLAGLVSLDQLGRLVQGLESDRDRLGRVLALDADTLLAGLDRVTGAARGVALPVNWRAEPGVREAADTVFAHGSPEAAKAGGRMLDWLGLGNADRCEYWAMWRQEFMLAPGVKRGLGRLVNKKLADRRPDLLGIFAAEQERLAEVDDRLRAIAVADLTAALLTLAAPIVQGYAAAKEASGQLDFTDLIGRTQALLIDPGAAWVLYKLDGGLDHLLLDEVQDTAPAQWAIAGALTADFHTGAGAREPAARARTIFAVGDRKQSIFSFQGADPASFEHWRGVLGARVNGAGEVWRDVGLDVSFRSTPPVLSLVDAVFAEADAASGVVADGVLAHFADRAGHAGRVELWPLVPTPPRQAPEPWCVPEQNLRRVSAPQRLADALADWLKRQFDDGAMLPSRGRPLEPGDVLILVRRRDDLARAIVRALKVRGVPVAGIDRMVLTDQPAVADLLALCDALLLPDDDLSLACVLTSPLGGLTDDSLMALAMGRRGRLWEALRARAAERADWAAAEAFVSRLLARVDFAAPHALLSEALGPLGGRARLLGRLGPEAAEPIDELLSAALTHARGHPPSLQGFLHWLRRSGAEVKREAESAGRLVRLMTVHGAKGLQAPLVILPDTTTMPQDEGPLSWAPDAATGLDLPVWSPRKELRCNAAEALRAAAAERQRQELNRLLYVALTRAEDRLVVCGWEPARKLPDGCWYESVRRGFARLGHFAEALPVARDPWAGDVLVHLEEQARAHVSDRRAQAAEHDAALPRWAGAAPLWLPASPPEEPALPRPLAPSRPEQADLGRVPGAASPLQARDAGGKRFRRGQLVHALLQHLPDIPEAEREAAARRYLDRPGHGLGADAAGVLADIMAVLAHPELAALFGPGSRAEVPLTGVVAGTVIGGLVDRLAVLPDRVLLADYKTNRAPPATADAVPVLYLRQMAAYRAVLRGALPGREISCALVWTSAAHVMALPHALLDRYAPGVAHAA